METKNAGLEDVVVQVGPSECARRLGISTQALWKMRRGEIRVTAERAVQIEAEFGVHRSRTRPDLFEK